MRETQCTKAVIDGDHNNITAGHHAGGVVVSCRSNSEAATVEPHHHWTPSVVSGRCRDVQFKTIFVAGCLINGIDDHWRG